MKVKDYKNGYCIVVKAYWDRYGKNAYVDRFTTDYEEAEYICSSLSRADNMTFIIVEV